jgi:hypothetical protein
MRSRRSKFLNPVLISLILFGLLSMLLSPSPVYSQTKKPLATNLDIILVIDQSETMYYRNDPDHWRIVMAELFTDLLGVDQSGGSHQLGILMFGSGIEWVSHLVPVDNPANRDAIKTNLKKYDIPMIATNIPAAIEAAQTELDTNGRTGSKKAIIFLSDGFCELPEATTDDPNLVCNQMIYQLINRQNQDNYPIFTIALTQDAFRQDPTFSTYKNLWQEIAGETGGLYFEPETAQDDLLNVYTQIIRFLLGLPEPSETPVPQTAPIEIQFDVPAGLSQIIFTAIKFSSGVSTEVIRPSGETIRQGGSYPDVKYTRSTSTDVYSVTSPEEGTWIVKLNGEGTALIETIQFPSDLLTVQYTLPGATFPQGKPMDK